MRRSRSRFGPGNGISLPPEESLRNGTPLLPAPQQAISAAALLPLRFFLGITFAYAAIQKVTDPGFFRAGSTTYIGTQIQQFSHASPLGSLLQHAVLPHARLAGFAVIGIEWTIGVLVILGWFTRLAALSGLFLNLGLFLSASWTVYPYFLGSDIVFVVGWLTLLLAGPGPYALASFRPQRERDDPPINRGASWPLAPDATATSFPVISRYELAIAGTITLMSIVLGIWPRNRSAGLASGSAAAPTGGAHKLPSWIRLAGKCRVGHIRQIPVNSALSTKDPMSGDPALIVHLSPKQFHAFGAVCTHAGCTVSYDPESRLLVCPCHGAEFDPAQRAQVVRGPAAAPLPALPLAIDSGGNMYLR